MQLVRSIMSLAVLLSACSGNAASSAPEAASTPSDTTDRCGGTAAVEYHGAPALEATLPSRIAGRDLATWSVAGRCWLEISFDDDAVIDDILSETRDPSVLDLSNLAQAVAGRSDTSTDPPYFVFATNRPQNVDELELTLYLLFAGLQFRDLDAAADLHSYEEATIAGKEVYVGTADMLDQNDHQRGRPYLYQTESTMFVVLTDDDAWAEEAIGQLP